MDKNIARNLKMNIDDRFTIKVDEFNLSEEEKANIVNTYAEHKAILAYNIKVLSKGTNLRNKLKVATLKKVRELDRGIYKDVDSFILEMKKEHELGKDVAGKGVVAWNEALKIS